MWDKETFIMRLKRILFCVVFSVAFWLAFILASIVFKSWFVWIVLPTVPALIINAYWAGIRKGEAGD